MVAAVPTKRMRKTGEIFTLVQVSTQAQKKGKSNNCKGACEAARQTSSDQIKKTHPIEPIGASVQIREFLDMGNDSLGLGAETCGERGEAHHQLQCPRFLHSSKHFAYASGRMLRLNIIMLSIDWTPTEHVRGRNNVSRRPVELYNSFFRREHV